MSALKRPVITVIEPTERTRAEIRKYLMVLIPNANQLHFASFQEALAGLKSFPPHLVLVDQSQAEKLLEAFPIGRRKFHVLVLKTGSSASDFESMKALGADDVCAMPIDELLLKAKIETLLFGLYASPFAFFADGAGASLSRISMSFSTQVYALNEEGVEFVSPVLLQDGAEIRLAVQGEELRLRVERCKPNPHRADSHFVRGVYAEDLSESARAGIRRLIASVQAGEG